MKVVVLAGGVGSRLWPLSRSRSPKQIQPFFGKATLLQKTFNRLRSGFSLSDIFVVTGEEFKKFVYAQLPKFPRAHVLVEPARRNTAAAIGLAAYTFAKHNPKEIMVSIASDHAIEDDRDFIRGLKAFETVINHNPRAVCVMGVHPSYPETGYGYIEVGKLQPKIKGVSLFAARRFVEKPTLPEAKKLLRSGRYLWNPSYFAWRVDRLQELFRQHIHKTDALLQSTVKGNRGAFKRIQPLAIEYAVMEKLTGNFFVLPASFGWADVGHWASVREIQAKSNDENVTLGLHETIDTAGSLIYNYTDHILTTVGVSDLLIVQTEDGTLVCRKDRAQDVKKLVEKMHGNRKLRKFV